MAYIKKTNMYPRSFRDYKHGMFEDMYKGCKGDRNCEHSVRGGYRGFERGRWVDAMDKLHRFIVNLDSDELEEFMRRYPKIIEIINEFAVIENLRLLR